MTLFRILAFMLLLASSLQAQFDGYSHWFGIPSTWNTQNGQTSLSHTPNVSERMAVWNAGVFNGKVEDIYNWNYTHLLINPIVYTGSTTTCYANNSDPLKTVLFDVGGSSFYMTDPATNDGPWNVLRIPDELARCQPPSGNDNLVTIVNEDDPDHIWAFYQLRRYTSGCPGGQSVCWEMNNVRRFARTRAQYDEDMALGRPTGRGMGVDSTYTPNSGAQGACHGSAAYPHGSVHEEDFVAGRLSHGITFTFFRESNFEHNKLYPCRMPGTVRWDYDNPDDTNPESSPLSQGEPPRVNAPWMGERLVLRPDINIDALDVGAATKLILKGIQEYFYMPVDSLGESISNFSVDNASVAGRDFRVVGSSFASQSAFTQWLFLNSREVACQPAYPNECIGADPPPDFPEEPDPVLTISTTSLPVGQEGDPYSATICLINGVAPYMWGSSGTLPPGLTLNSPSGNCITFSGTPTTAGTYNFTVTVDDAAPDSDDQTYQVEIDAAEPPDPTPPGPDPVQEGAISFTFATPTPGGHADWEDPIFVQWSRDGDLIPAGTLVNLWWRCGTRQWHTVFIGNDVESGSCTMPGCSGAYSFDPATFRVPSCTTFQFRMSAPVNGVNWGDDSFQFDLRGNHGKL